MQMSFLYASDLPFKKPHLFPVFDQFRVLVIVKNKLTSVFYGSVHLLKINFVITLSKFAAEQPLAAYSKSLPLR